MAQIAATKTAGQTDALLPFCLIHSCGIRGVQSAANSDVSLLDKGVGQEESGHILLRSTE